MKINLLWAGVIFFLATNSYGDKAYGNPVNMAVMSSMKRIFPGSEISHNDNNLVELWSARNEYKTTQVAISSRIPTLLNDVTCNDLVDMKTGKSISKDNFHYRFPANVYVRKNTSQTPIEELDGIAPGYFPDPLEEDDSMQVVGTRSLFLTWFIPHKTLPGDYKGQIVFSLDSKKYVIPVIIHVWNFALPDASSLFVTNWLHVSQIESRFGVAVGSDDYWRIIENIAKDLSRHRQNVIYTPLSLVKSTEMPDGSYTFDFTDYERWVRIFSNNGVRIFEGSHLFNTSKSYRVFVSDGMARVPVAFDNAKLKSEAGKNFLKIFLGALHKENVSLGIEKNYIQHVWDEFDASQINVYKEYSSIVKGAMPGVAIIDAITVKRGEVEQYMDVPVTALHKTLDDKTENPNSRWGKWWYTSVVPKGLYPNRFIDFPLMKSRVIPWLSWRFGISGYLNYGYNWWYTPSGKSPWEDVEQAGNYPPGDGFIVYPPKGIQNRNIRSSLRWEAFRDGLQDYEYLRLMDQQLASISKNNNMEPKFIDLKNRMSALNKKIISKIDSLDKYPRDPRVYDSLRYEMGSVLSDINDYILKNMTSKAINY